jgi:hypothetical protein
MPTILLTKKGITERLLQHICFFAARTFHDLFIECRDRAADAAHFGHDHSRIYLCGAVRIVNFWRGGLRRALAHSLKADRPSDQPPKFSTLFEFHRRRSTSDYQRRSSKK